jgi:hypothetical protein
MVAGGPLLQVGRERAEAAAAKSSPYVAQGGRRRLDLAVQVVGSGGDEERAWSKRRRTHVGTMGLGHPRY